jgi:hypothetical protein
MTFRDQVTALLCIWRENREGGIPGMQSVLNVLQNRAAKHGTTVGIEALKPEQFSSMTTPKDPQLGKGPNALDKPDWIAYMEASDLVAQAAAGTLLDITCGATNYYAASMTEPPYWAAEMTRTVEIAGQIFFR